MACPPSLLRPLGPADVCPCVCPHREHILKTAKALVEDTKLLVSGAGASQEKLAQAAQSSVLTITKLADVVKLGAASLGSEDPETQVGEDPLVTLCGSGLSSQSQALLLIH